LDLASDPLEKLFGRLEQSVFRYGWRLDANYFFISTMLVQITIYLTLRPAIILFGWAQFPSVQEAIRWKPMWLQFLEIMLLADLVQYWVHRLPRSVNHCCPSNANQLHSTRAAKVQLFNRSRVSKIEGLEVVPSFDARKVSTPLSKFPEHLVGFAR